MPDSTADNSMGLRQHWFGVLAKTPSNFLNKIWKDLADPSQHVCLRGPEVGMVMVRGRAGGTGERFNLGEMTVSRCSVRMENGTIGHGYVAGRNKRHAELAACFDAYFQDLDKPEVARMLMKFFDTYGQKTAERMAKSAATKVEFFTMVRGDD